jgi:hypothetical protein
MCELDFNKLNGYWLLWDIEVIMEDMMVLNEIHEAVEDKQ